INMLEEITVHAYDWQIGKDADTGYTTLHCWSLDRNSQPHLLRIHEFDAFCYVELPLILNSSYVNWTPFRVEIIYRTICKILGDENQPHRYRLEMKEKLYFYKGKNKKYPMLLLCFHNWESLQVCQNR